METFWKNAHNHFLERAATGATRQRLSPIAASAALEAFLSKSHGLHDSLFPTRKLEAWKYTSLRALEAFEPALGREFWDSNQLKIFVERITDAALLGPYWAPGKTLRLVTLDGVLRKDLSDTLPPGIQAQELPSEEWNVDTCETPSALRPCKDWGAALRALHAAFTPTTLKLSITEGSSAEAPVRIVWVNLRGGATESNFGTARLNLHLGAEQVVELLEIDSRTSSTSPIRKGETRLFLQDVDCHLGDRASLRLMNLGSTVQGEHVLTQHRAQLGTEAKLYVLCSAKGTGLLRNMTNAVLECSGAQVDLRSYYHPEDGGHIDNQLLVHHQVGQTSSSQHYKGLIEDGGTAVFHGSICIDEGADQTEAHQLNRNVILGPGAQVNTQPELRIDADEVACSHGATVGPLSEEEIFYLRSRGLTREQSLSLMREGFVLELTSSSDWSLDAAYPFVAWSMPGQWTPDKRNLP